MRQSILITSGGTRTRIDDVRHVKNISTGRFGSDIACEFVRSGQDVSYLYAKDAHAPHVVQLDVFNGSFKGQLQTLTSRAMLFEKGVTTYEHLTYSDFEQYESLLKDRIKAKRPSIVVLAAAVSDFAPIPVTGKIGSDEDHMSITLRVLPKLIRNVKHWLPSTFLVGFKLLSNSNVNIRDEAALSQMANAGSDLVVVNDIKDIRDGNHRLWVYSRDKVMELEQPNLASSLTHYILGQKEGWQ